MSAPAESHIFVSLTMNQTGKTSSHVVSRTLYANCGYDCDENVSESLSVLQVRGTLDYSVNQGLSVASLSYFTELVDHMQFVKNKGKLMI